MQSSKKSKRTSVYLDHAAATPVDKRVRTAMEPFFSSVFANPSALYAEAVHAREAIERAREAVSLFLKTTPDTIVFTSGGTESNNLAILGVAGALNDGGMQKKHVVTTVIEHSSVLEPIRELARRGWSVTYVPVNTEGIAAAEDVQKALRRDTMLVSVMYANNEIGSVQPIADIGRVILRWRKNNNTNFPYFHVDACQAGAYLPMAVDGLHVDLLTLNGGKIYGPKGTGVLYKKRGVAIHPIMFGGGQESGLHSGTENVPGIVGMGKALQIVAGKLGNKETRKLEMLRNYFWKKIQSEIKNVELNGPSVIASSPAKASRNDSKRLPNNLNISFAGCDAEALILYLSARGIAVSAGSACSSDSDEVSHVLLSCGQSEARAKSSVRFSLGKDTTKKDIDTVMKVLPGIVRMMRDMDNFSI